MSIISFFVRWLIWATLLILFVYNVRNPNKFSAADLKRTTWQTVEQTAFSNQSHFLSTTQTQIANIHRRINLICSTFLPASNSGQQLLLHKQQLAQIKCEEAKTDLSSLLAYQDSLLDDFAAIKALMVKLAKIEISLWEEILSLSNRHIQPGNGYHGAQNIRMDQKLWDFYETSKQYSELLQQTLKDPNTFSQEDTEENFG